MLLANYMQLEKDLNLQKDEENIMRCRGKLKNAPNEMMQSIQFFYREIVNSRS